MMNNQKTIPWRLFAIAIVFVVVMTGCTTIRPAGVQDRPGLAGKRFSHADFDQVLSRFVNTRGMVDYTALQADSDHLENYYSLIAAYSPDSHPQSFPDKNHQLAYWINAYNAAAIKTVLTRYPINSVLDVKSPAIFFFLSDKAGFFFFQRLSFGGKTTSLYYLENKVVRKRFDDPRIHFAINCASIGCPRLPQQAFTGEALDAQLENETRLFLSEARNYNIDHETKVINVSSIFLWYEKDFSRWYEKQYPGTKASVLDYIRLNLTPERAAALKQVAGQYTLKFIPYNWGLNDQKSQAP